jgi:hypothetical protein
MRAVGDVVFPGLARAGIDPTKAREWTIGTFGPARTT